MLPGTLWHGREGTSGNVGLAPRSGEEGGGNILMLVAKGGEGKHSHARGKRGIGAHQSE